MKRFSHSLLTLLAALSCISCTTFPSPTSGQNTRPDDFRVEYEWREGSLPPPYHYEYSVLLLPSGQGEIVLTPDYPAPDVPRWAEKFTVAEQELNALYRVMVENGLFTRKWRQVVPAPVGGSHQTLIVTAQGKQIRIEDHLVSGQQASAKAMYAAVQALVPKEIWDRLHARRSIYIREHPRREQQ